MLYFLTPMSKKGNHKTLIFYQEGISEGSGGRKTSSPMSSQHSRHLVLRDSALMEENKEDV